MSFLNPLFLLGLGAIAAPIIVHLVRRTRAQRVEFPSLMFVRRVPQRTIRRRRIQNLLLLLLRCLAFLLLVLAFVRPYFGSGQAETIGRRADVILLDSSFSMRYGDRFERAKDRARAVLDRLGAGERAAIVTFGQNYEVQNGFTADVNQLKATLANLQPGYAGTDYIQALRAAEVMFKDAGAAAKNIILISDFQASGRKTADTAYRLSKEIKLTTVDLGQQESPNLAISDVHVQPLIYQPKYSDKLTARIANYSETAKDGVRVEFQLNDHTVEKREIKIAARDAATVEFTGFNLNEGDNRATIQVEGDKFPFDNRHFAVLRRADQLKALIIESATRGRSESFYLRNALTTGENLPFKVESKTIGAVNPTEVAGYRVIILNDPGNIPQALATQITRFLEGGGGLIISVGPHTDPRAFNQAWQNVAPATLEEAVQLRGDYVSMSEIKTDHPIFEVFRQSGRLSAARVFGFHRATPHAEAAVLARFENGDPALIESEHGSGRVLLFTSTFDASWNDLPLTPIYLPLMRQMTRHLGEREESASYLLGETFTVAAAKDGTPPAIDDPSGHRVTDHKQMPTGELIVNAGEPGFYHLRYSGNSEYAAVNLDDKESDLSRLNLEEFVASLTGSEPAAQAGATVASGGKKLSNEEVEARQRVWWTLLVVALMLFVAEAILARRIKMAKVIG